MLYTLFKSVSHYMPNAQLSSLYFHNLGRDNVHRQTFGVHIFARNEDSRVFLSKMLILCIQEFIDQ